MTTTPTIQNTSIIGVVGLGYVGLPLLLAYAKKGFRVIGFDIDEKKKEHLLKGESYIKHIPTADVAAALSAGKLDATTDFTRIAEADAVILCIPTPLDDHFEPDLSYVRGTLDAVVPHLKAGAILSLESTTYPGTTEEEILPRVAKYGLVPGESVYVIYSPEREDPGNPQFHATNIPKVVGGHTATCLEAGLALYEAAFEKVVPVSSTKVAELTKLLENIYRAVNIGLVNELKIVFDKMGIDIWKVLDAAETKPFGFMRFNPGPGWGGHCIPIDPFYLTWKAREFGVHTRFIELSGEINRSMPDYVIRRTMEALNDKAKPVKGSRVLLLGLSYKADVDDMRESPTFALMDGFSALGAHVDFYDPHVPIVGPTREHAIWQGKHSVAWSAENLASYDVIVLSTHHKAFDLQVLANSAKLIVDTRNALANVMGSATVVKA